MHSITTKTDRLMTSTYIPRHIYCFLALLLWAACCITSCSGSTGQADMTRAEALMEEHPDSALSILETVDKSLLTMIIFLQESTLYEYVR